ncbi:hypothetical protein B0T24DRAFT_716496 [Lasiosphaeria ovina]|uniref:Uncharacterized protein n=1 Tax=Lasiosphaeria ovina TaxID=92902 RepID=A0AAE0KLD0_9PEZI|nr:hypothetical protein B0T24DRAFT_716496 [Lasiosphaeria ovina]
MATCTTASVWHVQASSGVSNTISKSSKTSPFVKTSMRNTSKTITGRDDVVVGGSLLSGSCLPSAQKSPKKTESSNPPPPETSEVASYKFRRGGVDYVLVNTPGFDDTNRPDREITCSILSWLAASSRKRPRKSSNITTAWFGANGFANVVLATTLWEALPPGSATREAELVTNVDFWGAMFAGMAKFTPAAVDEMVNRGLSADDTSAAREQRAQADALRHELEAQKLAEQLGLEVGPHGREFFMGLPVVGCPGLGHLYAQLGQLRLVPHLDRLYLGLHLAPGARLV